MKGDAFVKGLVRVLRSARSASTRSLFWTYRSIAGTRHVIAVVVCKGVPRIHKSDLAKRLTRRLRRQRIELIVRPLVPGGARGSG
jgi:hypothetical protein